MAGDGAGENLLGILNTVGIGQVELDAASALSDLTLDGLVSVIQADATPDAVVLNPTDWAGMLKAKAAGSTGSGSTARACSHTPPNHRLGPARRDLQGDAGRDSSGGRVRDLLHAVHPRGGQRPGFEIADQDDFVRNRVTALGELRAGLAVWQPAGFTEVALA